MYKSSLGSSVRVERDPETKKPALGKWVSLTDWGHYTK